MKRCGENSALALEQKNHLGGELCFPVPLGSPNFFLSCFFLVLASHILVGCSPGRGCLTDLDFLSIKETNLLLDNTYLECVLSGKMARTLRWSILFVPNLKLSALHTAPQQNCTLSPIPGMKNLGLSITKQLT